MKSQKVFVHSICIYSIHYGVQKVTTEINLLKCRVPQSITCGLKCKKQLTGNIHNLKKSFLKSLNNLL